MHTSRDRVFLATPTLLMELVDGSVFSPTGAPATERLTSFAGRRLAVWGYHEGLWLQTPGAWSRARLEHPTVWGLLGARGTVAWWGERAAWATAPLNDDHYRLTFPTRSAAVVLAGQHLMVCGAGAACFVELDDIEVPDDG